MWEGGGHKGLGKGCLPPIRPRYLVFLKKIVLRLSLHLKRNLTPVSNVCKAALISLFRALNSLSELSEMRFKFPFNLIGKSTMAF